MEERLNALQMVSILKPLSAYLPSFPSLPLFPLSPFLFVHN